MIRRNKAGFTIIELMLAMTFVSMLLVAIAVMTMQLSTIYAKGNTMKDLNSASRTINDDFTHTFNSMPTMNWPGETNAVGLGRNYIKQDGAGAFCTGGYTYLWNLASHLNDTTRGVKVRFANDNGSAGNVNDTTIRLVKVSDPSMSYCSNLGTWDKIPNNDKTVNLLPEGETGLMLYDVRLLSNSTTMFDRATSQRAINISYILGTKNDRNNGMINVSNMSCQIPANSSGMDEYCAINKFELTVRTLGKK